MQEGIDINIVFQTQGAKNKGSFINEKFTGQDLDVVRKIEDKFNALRVEVYKILRHQD